MIFIPFLITFSPSTEMQIDTPVQLPLVNTVTLRYKSLRGRKYITNNLLQSCNVCKRSAAKTVRFCSRGATTCHNCSNFCTICHCGTGGICVQNHTNARWTDTQPNDANNDVQDAQEPQRICQNCIDDPVCQVTKSCRCTTATGSTNCTLHHTNTRPVTLTLKNSCNFCLETNRNNAKTHRTDSKEQRRLRLNSLSLSIVGASSQVVPKKNDRAMWVPWLHLNSILSTMLVNMNQHPNLIYYKDDLYHRKLFNDQIAGILGLDGNYFGFVGGELVKRMINWFTENRNFKRGVSLKKLPSFVKLD